MIALGRRLGEDLAHGHIVLLEGGLGAGKTTLAKGLVAGFGAADLDDVSSPTFAIVHEYTPRRRKQNAASPRPFVYHLDLYRLEDEDELWAMGFEDILIAVLDHQAVMLVEWGERYPAIWPPDAHRIVIHEGDVSRQVDYYVPSTDAD